MNFISEWGFDVKLGKSADFQEWLRSNEEELGREAPEGWEYIGTYAAIVSSEKEAGDFRQFWRFDSYGAMDAWAEAMQQGGRFAELIDEMTTSFVDQDRGARRSQSIHKSVVDAAIWGE